MSNLYLFNYHDQRWDWTRTAVTKFIHGFNRFDGYVEDKEQVYIGVYGPTQVGKTTFILTLLGIEFERINQLADALRGGREKGKSATITCTIFKKTNESDFQIIWPSGQRFTCSTLEQVEQVMGQLRNEIYVEEQFSLTPLMVEIPKDYFNQEDVERRIRDLAIIDLPGDDSKDLREMHHVNRVLKEYISRCKVCIIMEIASQMTNLTKLDKEFVKDWTVLPEQFRILLTRSVTNGSVMRPILEGSVSSVEEYKALYRNELTRVSEMDELETVVYPLEFGDSWMDLKQTQPDLFHQANRWVQTLFNELVEDLTQIDSPEQEIRKIKSMERYIVKKQEKEVAALQVKIERTILELEEKEYIAGGLANKLKNENKKLERLEKAISAVDVFGGIKMPPLFIPVWSTLTYAEKKASYLRQQFDAELENLQVLAEESVDKLNAYIRQLNRHEQLSLSLMLFPHDLFDTSLYIDYVVDRYFKESTYSTDVYVAKNKLETIFNEFFKQYKEAIRVVKLALHKKIALQDMICADYKEQYIQQLKNNCQLQARIDELTGQFDEANKEWQEDIERSRQLDLFLKESFIEQSAIYKERLFDQTRTKSERWVIHQYWNLLKMQAERIIDDGY
jgi:GTPase SAR1 family protein